MRAQQVLGEVELALGEEARARHLVLVGERARTGGSGDAREFPEERPEILHPVDRPGMEARVIAERQAVALVRALNESRGEGVRGALGRWRPEGLGGHARILVDLFA